MFQAVFGIFSRRRRKVLQQMRTTGAPCQTSRPWPVPSLKPPKSSRFSHVLRPCNMVSSKGCFMFVFQFGIAFLIFQFLRTGKYMEFERTSLTNQDSLDEWDRTGNLGVLESLSSSSNLKLGADVEGANIDHNGSTANRCLTERPLLLRALQEKVPSPFSGFGIHSFVLRSSYRVNDQHFVAIGLSALSLHSMKMGIHCEWHASNQKRVEGRQFIVWPGEHHDLMYESAIYHCELEEGTKPGVGGSLVMTIDEELTVVYTEENGRTQLEPTAPFKYNLAFCSFPVYRDAVPQRLSEWLQYAYRYVGVDYFVLHDGGPIDESFMEVLNPYLKSGLMEIIDVRAQYQFESKHNVLTLNDCLYRMRWVTNWALFVDFDEYLYAEPPRTVLGIIKEHSQAPYMTFGSLWWSIIMCRSSEEKRLWPVERMTFHWPGAYCVLERAYPKEKCLNYHGHRKFLVNPRKVWVLEVHRPIDPIEGGVDLNTTMIRSNHFQGLLRSSSPTCSETITQDQELEWWVESHDFGETVRRVREAGPPSKKLRIRL